MKAIKNLKQDILFLLVVLLAYATDMSAAKQRAELARFNQLSDAALLARGKQLVQANQGKLALSCFELLQNRGDRVSPQLRAECDHQAGLVFYANDNYSKAMENFMNCMDLCEKQRLDSLLALTYKDIGNIYSMFGDYDQSVPLYKKALKMARAQGNLSLANKMLNNLIFAYQPKTPLRQYRQWYRELCSHKEQRPRYRYDVLLAAGVIEDYAKNMPEAIRLYKQAANYASTNGLGPLDIASVNGMLSDAFSSIGRRDSALAYLKRNLQLAEENNIPPLKVSCYRALSELYQSTDRSKALDYKQKYLLLRDSIFNLNALSEIQNALFFHEIEKNLNTIKGLNKTNQDSLKTISNQQAMLVALTLCAIVFLTLLAITWRQKRKLSSAYHSLFNKTQESIQHDKVITRQLDAMDKSDRKKDSNVPPVAPPKKEPDETEREVRLKPEVPVVMHDKVRTMPNAEQQNELLAAILQVMENTDAYCDPEFGIEKLATMTNSNSRYVSQVINEVYGMNFRALVNDFRIKKAMIRMSDTENYGNLTIRAIAESVGYKSQANFINVFTKITGLKPSTYLKLLKEKQLDKAS